MPRVDRKSAALAVGDKLCEVEQLIGQIGGQVIRATIQGEHTTASVACLNTSKLRQMVGELGNLLGDFEKSLR